MRPVLKPALPRLWRDATTVQFGVDPRHAVVVSGVDGGVRVVLQLLDGTRDAAQLLADAERSGVDPSVAGAVLDRLRAAGVVEDAGADTAVLRALEVRERDRLAAELAALSVLQPRPGAALATLARRRCARAAVLGTARAATLAAELLREAGVGAVATHPTPAALAVAQARRPADVAVWVTVGTAPVAGADELRALGVPHLAVVLREAAGAVGPLVLPGRSSCLRCLHLHRGDRDPAWPLLALQLEHAPASTPACPAALSAMLAGVAALQALAYVDGEPRPAAVDGTLELALPDWRVRRRSWRAHPACPCGATTVEPMRQGMMRT